MLFYSRSPAKTSSSMTALSTLKPYLKKPALPVVDSLDKYAEAQEGSKGAKSVVVYREDGIFNILAPFFLWAEQVAVDTIGKGVKDMIQD